jgi:peptide chain release factor 1
VPPTERKGRVHTSTVTVAVMSADAVKSTQIPEHDLRIEWYSGTGAGGQNRNKVMNSCRITHIPSGIVATAQTRDRSNSLKLAKDTIIDKVKTETTVSHQQKQSADRKLQVGTGMRGDKIRTYRFQDDTVTDHRSDKKMSAKKVLAGNFDLLW